MKLVQVFVPLTDNDGNRFSESYFETLKSDLNEKFGGVTVYKQMPKDRGNLSFSNNIHYSL